MSVDIRERRALRQTSIVHLIGPGGVGKSTVGKLLSEKLGWSFLDLDAEFVQRIAPIGEFIRRQGYQAYQEANSELANAVIRGGRRRLVAALSSGFLADGHTTERGARNRALVQETGASFLLLPSAGIDEATEIVVARQLLRGFGLEAARERAKFRSRFGSYLELGDVHVFSSAAPAHIASAIAERFTGDDEPV